MQSALRNRASTKSSSSTMPAAPVEVRQSERHFIIIVGELAYPALPVTARAIRAPRPATPGQRTEPDQQRQPAREASPQVAPFVGNGHFAVTAAPAGSSTHTPLLGAPPHATGAQKLQRSPAPSLAIASVATNWDGRTAEDVDRAHADEVTGSACISPDFRMRKRRPLHQTLFPRKPSTHTAICSRSVSRTRTTSAIPKGTRR